MDFKSMEDILSFATEKEKEAVEFYTEISKVESYSGAKKTFQDFAKEEVKHVSLLENFSKDKEKIEQYEFKWIPDLKRSDYMVDITYEKGMTYNDILRFAMKREEKALKLYNELIEKTDKDEFVKLFKMLAQEEAKHKNILETLYDDFMAKQGD